MAEIYRGARAPRNFSGIGAVIFDLDRTVIDTVSFEHSQWNQALRRVGMMPLRGDPPDVVQRKMELNRARKADALAHGNGDPRKFYELLIGAKNIDEDFWQFHRDQVKHFAREQKIIYEHTWVLDTLHAHRIPVAFYTSRSRNLLDAEHCPPLHYWIGNDNGTDRSPGMRAAYEAMVTADDVTRLKPNPEGLFKIRRYFKNTQKIDIPFDTMLMVGDSASDTRTVKAVGGMACGLAFRDDPALIRRHYDAGADLIVESMNDLLGGAIGPIYTIGGK